MQTRTVYTFVGSLVISAFCVFGLNACTNDSGSVATDGADSTAKANAVSPANPDSAGTAASASTATAKIPAKKRKTFITMPDGSMTTISKDEQGVYNHAEVMPQYPGGMNALSNYVNDHLQYNQMALDQNTTGVVRISFVVDENGKVLSAHLLGNNKVGNGLDEEALRVVSNMPSWKPGTVKGKNVKTRLELPISFQLEA